MDPKTNHDKDWIQTELIEHSKTGSDAVLSDVHVSSKPITMPFGLKLKHTSEATPLPLVGLQVWNGALLLAEYISWRRSVVVGKRVVEVGAGTGVVSFVAAAVGAVRVVATDVGVDVLGLLKEN
ncbi:Methyltransferase-like protein 22, partial [Rhizoclosmatium hyalinum]